MSIRRTLGVTAAAVGAAAIGNRLLYRRAGELENPLPGIERRYRWRGMDVRYTVAGDPNAPEVLCVHGIHAAASAEEFRPLFETLSEDFRVIAVDLPGFGRSDRPPLVYSSELYAEFLRAFARDVTEEPTVVASSLSGAFATVAARAAESADGEGFDRLVLVCPTAETGAERPWLRTLLRSPLLGTTAFSLLVSRPSLRYFFDREGYYDASNLDPETLAYAWRSAHQPGARYAPASFVAGSLDPGVDLATELAALEAPVTLVWGREADLVPLEDGRDLADAADATLAVVDHATQLPHVEHPGVVAEYLRGELLEVAGG